MDRVGVSQRELSRRMEVDEGAVSRWLNKGRLPSLTSLMALSRAMPGVTINYLLGMEAEPPPRLPKLVDQRAVRRLIRKLHEAGEAAAEVAASLPDENGE